MIPLGIVLLVMGVILIIGEFFTGSGLLMGIGIICLIIGLVLLIFETTFQIEWWLVILVGVIVAGILAFIIQRIRKTYHRQATTGREDLKGKIATVRQTLNPEGTVFYQGELWNAVSSSGKIQSGDEVIITGIKGLKLFVEKKEKE